MMTSINGLKQAYFFKDGYLRTASQEFWLDEIDEIASHLTNDAIQKHVEGYGRFEAGNKLSYADFQKHLDHYHPGTSFQKDIYPSIKRIVTDTMIATFDKIDIHRRLNSFEIFGYDFMIDDKMKVWLIE